MLGLPNLNYCVVGQLYYPIAKTLAEKAGWDFAKETGFDVVMINPGTALGPLLPPRINSSMEMLVSVLKGNYHHSMYTNVTRAQPMRKERKSTLFLNDM